MKLSKEASENPKTFTYTLIIASLIVSVGLNVSSFFGKEDANTTLELTLRSPTNEAPHLGLFQLGEKVTDDYIENFADNYNDINGDTVEVEVEAIDGGDYEFGTKQIFTDRFPVSETETMSLKVVTGKDGNILRIGNSFAYRNRMTCEASYEHIKKEVKEFYNIDEKPFKEDINTDYLAPYHVHADYPIGNKFYVSVSHDCGHNNIKDVIVRVGLLKEFYLESFATVDVDLYTKTLFIP